MLETFIEENVKRFTFFLSCYSNIIYDFTKVVTMNQFLIRLNEYSTYDK